MVSISKPRLKRTLLVISLVLLIAAGSFYLGQVLATPSPTIGRTVTPGNMGPCSWFLSLDGTTPVAEAMIGGLSVGVGDNIVGTGGQDLGAFINTNLIGANTYLCIGAGTYTFTTALNANQDGYHIACAGTQNTILQRSGNGDLIDAPNKYFTIHDCTLMVTGSAQTSGIGLKIFGFQPRAYNLNIGSITASQYFSTGMQIGDTATSLTLNGVFWGINIANSVKGELNITSGNGGMNDIRISDLVIENYGVSFTNNPAGITVTQASSAGVGISAIFLDRITISQCDPGILVNPAGSGTFEDFWNNLNVDTNWGQGIVLNPRGTATIQRMHWSDVWSNTNLQKVGATDNPSVQLTNVAGFNWVGGEVAGNPWEGVIINGTAARDTYLAGVDIRDNNPAGHLGSDGMFTGSNTFGLLVNAANLNFSIFGGNVGNPATGYPLGKQSGIAIFNANNVLISGVDFTPAVANGKYGLGVGTVPVLITGSPGLNPIPVRSVTAGASVWTFTNGDSVMEQLQLTTVNGLTSWTCRAITMSNTVLTYSPVLYPQQSCAVTWATTAPVFEVYPQ